MGLILLAIAGACLALARYSVFPARSKRTWLAALVATELGHLWAAVMLALALAGAAASSPSGGAATALAALAAGVFLRPVWCGWRLSRGLEARLRAIWGAPPEAAPRLWSWRRLLRWPNQAEEVPVETHDAAGRALDFYRARSSAEAEGSPCVVLVHGGGWDGGDRTELAALNRWLAARGVAVAAFDYRLAPQHPWPAQAEDLRVVIEWIRAHAAQLGVNPERLTLLGRSAGGQIATATAYGENLPGVRAVVALYACHDLEFVWSIRSEKDALNSAKLMTQFLGGGPEGAAQAERYRSASGERLVHGGAPPTLLIHGALDELVWCRHSERLAAALARAGVPHVFVKLPWATHAGEANLHGPAGQLITGAVLRVATGR